MATWASGDKITSAKANRLTCIGRAVRTTNSSTVASTTCIGVLRLDNVICKANYLYAVDLYCHPTSTVSSDSMRVEIRYKAGGTAGVADSILADAQAFVNFGVPLCLTADMTFGVDSTVSLLVCVARASGSGNASLVGDGTRNTNMRVHGIGVDPGNTGVNI